MTEPVVKITLDDIYDQGQRTAERVTGLEHKFDTLTGLVERQNRHSDRMDELDSKLDVTKSELSVLRERVDGLHKLMWWILAILASGVGSAIVFFINN